MVDFFKSPIMGLLMWQFLLIALGVATCIILGIIKIVDVSNNNAFSKKNKKKKMVKSKSSDTQKPSSGYPKSNVQEKRQKIEPQTKAKPYQKAEAVQTKETTPPKPQTLKENQKIEDEINLGAKGKYTIDVKLDGYHFYLIANNGQLLFDNPGFTTTEGAERGIQTFQEAVKDGKFNIYKDKYNRYRFILNNRYAGENYSTRKACENSVESVKRFALNANLIPYEPNPEQEKRYEEVKKSVKRFKDIDWESAFSEPIEPSGKFEIAKEGDGYSYNLVANNGQLLYNSNIYKSKAGAKKGVEAFKKAAYAGNFYVDEDKFQRYRYILKGGNYSVTYLGESYDTKQSAINSVESVKRFAMSAVIKEEEDNKIE